MPTLPSAFSYLTRVVTRDPSGSVPFAITLGGQVVSTDRYGLPLRGVYDEREAVETVTAGDQGHDVVTSRPVLWVDAADLPRFPRRGDVVTFDDGPMRVAQEPLRRGAGLVEIVLTRPSAGA